MRSSKVADRSRDILSEQHLRNVLRAIGVPGLDREQDGRFRARPVAFREQARDQFQIVLDHACGSPDLHPLVVLIIYKEDHGARILGKIAGSDVLPVAAENRRRPTFAHRRRAGRRVARRDAGCRVGYRDWQWPGRMTSPVQ
jgi:hypothetical protein